ncbi:MAG: hypothetical protein NC131_06300 [Roseburia sp.]|nr:hypothetical protein [Roseburia sp.]
MDPILISNSYILEAVQPETLEEPVGKSTILYANRFSGVQEVDIQDPALLEILNSTIGSSGNNVLVQLKQKMQAYPGGPWYVDSNDGVVHIHNRKFTQKTAHVYTYLAEPGEVLSASFKIVEVYKQNTAGLAAYVNAVNKTVAALLNPQVDNPPEQPIKTPTREELRKMLSTHDRKSQIRQEVLKQFPGYADTCYLEIEVNRRLNMENAIQGIAQREQADANYQREWNAKTPQQRQAVRNQYCNTAFNNAVDNGLEARVRQSPEYQPLIIKWDYYRKMCDQYGSNSPQAKKAWDEYKGAGADRAYISGIKTDEYWDWHEWDMPVWNTRLISTSIGSAPNAATSQNQAIQTAITNWKKKMGSKLRGEVTIMSNSGWKEVNRYVTKARGSIDRGEEYISIKEKCTLHVKAYTLSAKPYRYPLSRLLGEYTSNGAGAGSNPMAAMQAAAANIGRAKKEKQLQANIRVVGNPHLESTQQFIIQNVGSKYSGVWYIKAVSHVFEHGQGYICDVTLSKQLGKSKASGGSSTVNTRNYTSGQGKGSTSKKGRPLANRVPSDDYTYQDAMNEQWTAEEALYIENAVMSQPDEASARRTLEAQSYNVADKNMYNRQNNASTRYVTVGNGTATSSYNPGYSRVKREPVKLPKQALDVLRRYKSSKGK